MYIKKSSKYVDVNNKNNKNTKFYTKPQSYYTNYFVIFVLKICAQYYNAKVPQAFWLLIKNIKLLLGKKT